MLLRYHLPLVGVFFFPFPTQLTLESLNTQNYIIPSNLPHHSKKQTLMETPGGSQF